MTTDKAGIWQRVSTGGQDEASQLPDLTRWCETHAYEVAERYVLHGKSASKGKQDAYVDQVIRDMQDGKINVVVVWQSSRIERRGAYNAFDLARRVREAGGRIEYVKDAYLNDANEMSDVMLALAATKDRQKSRELSEQVIAKHEALRAAGSVVGPAPWGYKIVCSVCGDSVPRGKTCHAGVKVPAPTADGRKYIPVIFQMVVDGKSLRNVAAWLTAEGAPTKSGKPWNEAYICNRLIKNPTYYGARPNSGQLETEALVTYSTWQEANAKLTSRARPGRSTVKSEKALVSPVCGNPDCNATGEHPSPMYRIFGGRGGYRKAYYRCTGRGPQRKGCGYMIPADDLNEAVIEAMSSNYMDQYRERVFVPGDDRSDEIGKLRERGAEAMRQGDYPVATEAMKQAEELENMPRVKPHWEETDTDQTVGEHFVSLNADGQREMIAAEYQISASKDDDGRAHATIIHLSFMDEKPTEPAAETAL